MSITIGEGKKPKIRFQPTTGGEYEPWEKKAFYDCVEINAKLVDPTEGKYSNYPHIGPANIEKHTGRLLGYKLVKEEDLISGKYEFSEEDIVYGKINPQFGKVVFPKFRGLCSADSYPIASKKDVILPDFLFQVLLGKPFLKYSTSVSMRTGMPKINREELGGFNFYVPPLEEQHKIASFFSLLDQKIEKQEEKINQLELFKKGMLQKIFSQELRFKGFVKPWETKRLDKLCTINPRNEELPDEFLYIDLESVENGRLVKELEVINVDEAPSRAQRLLSPGDILFQTVRPYQKNNYHFTVDFEMPTVASTGYAQLRAKGSPEFLYQLIHTDNFLKQVLLRCTGSSYPAINSSDLTEIEVEFPKDENEQAVIGSFLSTLDKKMDNERKKLKLFTDLKKGFMYKMFM